MTGSRPDPDLNHPDDPDPTGVRSLLANLPAPGKMPEDLVARIAQSLELEQQRRSANGPHGSAEGSDRTDSVTPLSAGGGADDGAVISLDAVRQRRRPGRTVLWLGGAAAVAMVATLSVNQFFEGDSDAGVSAQVPAGDSVDAGAGAGMNDQEDALDRESEADAADAGDAPAAEPLPPGAGDEGTAESAAEDEEDTQDGGEALGAVALSVFSAEGTIQLSSTGWDDQVSSWISAEPVRGSSSWTSRDALDCVTTHDLEVADSGQLLLSDASWDQSPAVLLVSQEADGATAWVISTDCTDVLSGPVAIQR